MQEHPELAFGAPVTYTLWFVSYFRAAQGIDSGVTDPDKPRSS